MQNNLLTANITPSLTACSALLSRGFPRPIGAGHAKRKKPTPSLVIDMWKLFAAYHRIMLGETLLKGIITNTGRVCRYASREAKMGVKSAGCEACVVLVEGEATHPNKPFKHIHWHILILQQRHYPWQFKKTLSHELLSLIFLTACFSHRKYSPWLCLVGISSKVTLCHGLCFALFVYDNVMSCLLWILDK